MPAEFDAAVRRQGGAGNGDCRLDLGRAMQRVDDAGELDQKAAASTMRLLYYGSARSAFSRPSAPSSSASIGRE
jgi:hypothetical protein